MNKTTNHSLNLVDIFDERYYNINKRLLCFVGLWPYQSVFERSVRTTCLVVVDISLLVPQMLQLVQSWGNAASFIECFSPLITNIGCYFKLTNCIVHRSKIRRLLDWVRDDWECTHNSPELKILHEHGRKGRGFTIAYLTLVYTAITAWASTPLIPIVMDMVAPLNESRPNIKFFPTDYRVDPDKYFYSIYFHSSLVTAICMLYYVAFDTIFMALAQHTCAMLNIVRYRLETMTQGHNEVNIRPNTNIREDLYYQRVVDCMKTHKGCIEFIRVFQASCQWYLLFLVCLNMLVISFTGSQTVAKGTTTEDVLRFGFFTVAQVVHLFCNSLPGQWIMETSSSIQNSVYACNWYLMSTRSQKLMILFLRRSSKPCVITAGKMYVMSMENFCCVLQTSMSYLTLLTSMQ